MSRVAVVTGAASGIGLGVARQFARDGYLVGLLDWDAEGVQKTTGELQQNGHSAVGVQVDVSDSQAVARAFDQVRSELGPVTILVTSAGIDSFDSALDITPEKWERVLAVNLTGTFFCIQAALPDMIAAGWGRVVTISSSAAQSGSPRMAHYALSLIHI